MLKHSRRGDKEMKRKSEEQPAERVSEENRAGGVRDNYSDDPMSFGYFEEHRGGCMEWNAFNEGSEHSNSKFTCYYCGNESFCLKKLRAHVKTAHAGPKRISDQSKLYEAIIIYSCPYCCYRSNDNTLYSNHLRGHLAELPVAKKMGKSQVAPTRREPQGKMKERLRCPYCPFRTAESKAIRQHMSDCHENQRPFHYLRERRVLRRPIDYPCPECEYAANRSGTLKRHIMARHTKERPHHCAHCEYQATQNETLRRHILAKHTREKPHRCPRCSYSAVQRGTLMYHVKSKHNLSWL